MPEVDQEKHLSVTVLPIGVPFDIVRNRMGTDDRILHVVYGNLSFDSARWNVGEIVVNSFPAGIAFENDVACGHGWEGGI